jgi:hypothetical protein
MYKCSEPPEFPEDYISLLNQYLEVTSHRSLHTLRTDFISRDSLRQHISYHWMANGLGI